jgi:uncharacterized protein YndB with AHSA1/START domain
MKTNNSSFKIEKTFNAPAKKVWKAITNKMDMKKWYFDIGEFKAEPGYEFHFYAGNKDRVYLHLCTIKEIIEEKKSVIAGPLMDIQETQRYRSNCLKTEIKSG